MSGQEDDTRREVEPSGAVVTDVPSGRSTLLVDSPPGPVPVIVVVPSEERCAS